jgi:hypothetical protein
LNGICIDSKCICREGFSGDDCNINLKSVESQVAVHQLKKLFSFREIEKASIPKSKNNSNIFGSKSNKTEIPNYHHLELPDNSILSARSFLSMVNFVKS